MADRGTEKLSDIDRQIRDLTEGNPYVFVASPFDRGFSSIFDVVESVARNTFGYRCIRGDHVKGQASKSFLVEKIHSLIKGAQMVIADISKVNGNVFYEVGYAVGQNIPVVLIASQNAQVPVDLSGQEFASYESASSPGKKFRSDLEQVLKDFDPDSKFVHDMLVAEKGPPTYIVASPKPGTKGEAEERRTFGDNLGIRGLLAAFGLFFGLKNRDINVVSGRSCPTDILENDANLFLIGSPMVNRLVRGGLSCIQKGRATAWRFGWLRDAKGARNYALYQKKNGRERPLLRRMDGTAIAEDYGIIVRAPHPLHNGRLIMVLAGSSSVGTGAACLAATQPQLVRTIKSHIDIADHRQPFWVLVKGQVDSKDHLLDESGVSVEEWGVYLPRERKLLKTSSKK